VGAPIKEWARDIALVALASRLIADAIKSSPFNFQSVFKLAVAVLSKNNLEPFEYHNKILNKTLPGVNFRYILDSIRL
jgi:hypothetical protein